MRQVKGLRLIEEARQRQQLQLLLECSHGICAQVCQELVYFPIKHGCQQEQWCAGAEGRRRNKTMSDEGFAGVSEMI